MIRYIPIWGVAFLTLILSGCEGMRLQDEAAGTTRLNLKGCESTAGAPYICELSLIDGKARKDVELTATRGDTTITYSAKEATVDGQAHRAMVHGAMIAAFSDVLPQLIQAVGAARGISAPVTPPAPEVVE